MWGICWPLGTHLCTYNSSGRFTIILNHGVLLRPDSATCAALQGFASSEKGSEEPSPAYATRPESEPTIDKGVDIQFKLNGHAFLVYQFPLKTRAALEDYKMASVWGH